MRPPFAAHVIARLSSLLPFLCSRCRPSPPWRHERRFPFALPCPWPPRGPPAGSTSRAPSAVLSWTADVPSGFASAPASAPPSHRPRTASLVRPRAARCPAPTSSPLRALAATWRPSNGCLRQSAVNGPRRSLLGLRVSRSDIAPSDAVFLPPAAFALAQVALQGDGSNGNPCSESNPAIALTEYPLDCIA